MPFPFHHLPSELIDLILVLLRPEDIVNLSKCLPVIISQEVYNSVFHAKTRFAHYDLQMFKRRAGARIYVVGTRKRDYDPEKNPILDQDLLSHCEIVGTDNHCRLHTPWKVRSRGTIVQADLFYGGLSVLNTDGEIYKCDGDQEEPFAMHRVEARRQADDNFDARRSSEMVSEEKNADLLKGFDEELRDHFSNYNSMQPPAVPQCVLNVSEEMFRQHFEPTRFAQTFSPCSWLAQDDTGQLWKTDDSGAYPLCLVERNTGEMARVPNIKDGNNNGTDLAFLPKELGVVVPVSMRAEHPNGIRAGFPVFDDHLCYTEVESVPGTGGALNFGAFRDHAVCLWPDGQVSAVPLYGDIEVDTCDLALKIEELNQLGPFVQIAAGYSQVALVTVGGCVVTFTETLNSTFVSEVVGGFEDCNVVSVAVGNYHCLALTNTGDVYFWGREYNLLGGLGLGKIEDALMRDHVTVDENYGRQSLWVPMPVRLDLPGRVYAVYASDDMSAFLMEDVDE